MARANDKIPNFSTSVDVDKTVSEIQRMLSASRWITSVTYTYRKSDNGVDGLSFVTDTSIGSRRFVLSPAVAQVEIALGNQWRDGLIGRKYTTTEQAERVAWRLLRDWIELLLAYVRIGLFSFEDAMMSQMVVDDDTGQTVSDAFRSQALVPVRGRPVIQTVR